MPRQRVGKEDMSGGKTRRVIEVQSDLYQKGNLEKEALPNHFTKNATVEYKGKKYTVKDTQMGRTFATLKGETGETLKNIHIEDVDNSFRKKEIKPLEQYSNPKP